MSYSQFYFEQHETKSNQDQYIDQFEKWESDQQSIIRRNSLPLVLEDGERNLKEKYILSRIKELGLDCDKASNILKNMSYDIVKQNDENMVLHRVIQIILLMDTFPKATSKKQQRHYFEQITQLIGKTGANFLSCLNFKNSKGQQDFLLDLTCTICLNDMKNKNIILDCHHQFCLDCLNNYIVDKISNGQVEEICCPQILCKFQITDDILQSIIDQDQMNKLKRFRKIKIFQIDQDIIWCPRPGCEEVIKKSKKKNIKCICGQLICKKCNRKLHRGQSCKEQLDSDFLENVKKFQITKCKKCRSLIQKNEGCNHIICQQCRYEFCWLCKSRFTKKHYKYYNIFGCPGLKFSHRDPFKYPNLLRFLRFIFILIFGIPLFLIGLIIGIIALSFSLPAIIYMNCVHLYKFQNYHFCKKAAYVLLLFIACILLSPLSTLIVSLCLVIAIITSICYSFFIFLKWVIKK
ncbi:unnamed protein product [Paramecium sonneborni]|uniref:RBR-type E3 ubiquitin transferase n=1 Tax=Paramecium sonneborni TaxID=65129 RepID=A0A8S1NKL3_9CILI|nr:unnamed protein product [Paramecium sonneborni]